MSEEELVVMAGGPCDGITVRVHKGAKTVHFPTPKGLLEYHRCDFDLDGTPVFQQDPSKDIYQRSRK